MVRFSKSNSNTFSSAIVTVDSSDKVNVFVVKDSSPESLNVELSLTEIVAIESITSPIDPNEDFSSIISSLEFIVTPFSTIIDAPSNKTILLKSKGPSFI